MDDNKILQQKEKLIPALTSFLQGVSEPQSGLKVLFYQFEESFPVYLTPKDIKESKQVGDYKKIMEPSELADFLVKVVCTRENKKKEYSKIREELLKKLDLIKEDFLKTWSSLKVKLLGTSFPHDYVLEFLLNYLDGNLNDANKLKEALEEMRGTVKCLRENIETKPDENKIKQMIETAEGIQKSLSAFVERINNRQKLTKVTRFTSIGETSWSQNSNIDAICIAVNKTILLCGFALYRPNTTGQKITYEVGVYLGDQMTSGNQVFNKSVIVSFLQDGQKDTGGKNKFFHKLIFEKPISIAQNTKFLLTSKGNNINTYKGSGGSASIVVENRGTLTFSKPSCSANGTDHNCGMFPVLFFQ